MRLRAKVAETPTCRLVALFVALLMAISTILMTHIAAREQAGAGGNSDASDHGRGFYNIDAN